MTDEELARHCGITVDQVGMFGPDMRKRIEKMIDVADRFNRGEIVPGTIVRYQKPAGRRRR